jgi:hypothetical protein
MSYGNRSGKCRHFETCNKIQNRIRGNDWKGIEDTLVYVIRTTCSQCERFEAEREEGD